MLYFQGLYLTCVRGFEPPTPWSVAKCSIQLSYTHIIQYICYCLTDKKYNITLIPASQHLFLHFLTFLWQTGNSSFS